MPLAGKPLVAHSIEHARSATKVQATYISTDSNEIAALARSHGAQAVMRPPELSSDAATSEAALLHVLDDRMTRGSPDPELVVFLQATSPVRRADDIDRAIDRLVETGADSLFSACENRRFIWDLEDDQPNSVNYDFRRRPREQEMGKQYRENGSIYVFKPWVLRSLGNRLGGKISIYEMSFWSSFQLDSPDDAELLQWIMTSRSA